MLYYKNMNEAHFVEKLLVFGNCFVLELVKTSCLHFHFHKSPNHLFVHVAYFIKYTSLLFNILQVQTQPIFLSFGLHLSFFSSSPRSENLPSISCMLISFHYFPLSLLNLVKISGRSWFSGAIMFLATSGT